jgi:hypothetical protein
MVRADLPQTDLFGAPSTEATPRKPRRPAVAAVAPADADVALAAALPRELHLGTSTWSFAGWQGLVYDGAHEESKLAREGLAAYARHPLLRNAARKPRHRCGASSRRHLQKDRRPSPWHHGVS